MVKFLMYIIESGLCLTILFLVYLVLLKKETYFQFNRIYLISIIFFSALLPFMHFNFNINDHIKYESYFNKINKIKTSYEHVIGLADVEELNISNNITDQYNVEQNKSESNIFSIQTLTKNKKPKSSKWSITNIIIIIYSIGASLLLFRFILFLIRINKTLRFGNHEKKENYTLVKVQQSIAPFSFFKFIFINKDDLDSNNINQIIAHEKIHVKQGHTIDLILIQLLCILHWYNPLVWFLLKAIKTNHEFIADSEVLSNGYNTLEYQELLLNQFISFPTIKIVNNLNLTSIKDRIKMMNKFKSNKLAKLKPILIIPFALFVFLLFSNLTINTTNNYAIFNNDNAQLMGMWKNESSNTYGKYILFENTKISLLENQHILREFPYQITDNKIILNLPNKEKTELNFTFIDKQLKIWWGNDEFSVFNKSKYDNTLDEYLSEFDLKLNLPIISEYKILKRPELCINVIISDSKYLVNGKETEINNLHKTLMQEKSNMNALYETMITVNIFSDIKVPMNMVTDLKQTLRETNLLKICYIGIANDNKASKLEARFVGVPRKLPPLVGTNEVEVIKIVPDSTSIN